MQKKKIIYLIAGFGHGHKMGAKGIQEALDRYYPHQYEHVEIDIIALLGPSLDRVIEFLYKRQIQYAKLSWKAVFEITDKMSKGDFDRRFYPLIKTALKPITESNPDLIISCYPLFTHSVSRYLKDSGVSTPIVSLVTDIGDVHTVWTNDSVNYYLVPTFDTGFYLEQKGVQKEKIKTFGFPLRQDFYKNRKKDATRKELGIPGNKKVIMIMNGGWGNTEALKKLKKIDSELSEFVFFGYWRGR